MAHNLHLKARAQCAHRKMQNMYIYKNRRKKEQTAHQDISTTTPWTIIRSTKKKRKITAKTKTKKYKKKLRKP